MSLWRILIVRYSRFSPRTSRFSFFTTVPAPWWGYTTLSPTLNKPCLPLGSRVYSSRTPAGGEPAGGIETSIAKAPQIRRFSEKSLLFANYSWRYRSTRLCSCRRRSPARIAEQLGHTLELEQLLVAERAEALERHHGLRPRADGVIVLHDRGLLARNVAEQLAQAHADQAALGAELDAVALDLLGHPRRQLSALQDDEHVV